MKEKPRHPDLKGNVHQVTASFEQIIKDFPQLGMSPAERADTNHAGGVFSTLAILLVPL
jgi:hypothetical protein